MSELDECNMPLGECTETEILPFWCSAIFLVQVPVSSGLRVLAGCLEDTGGKAGESLASFH